MAKATRAHVKIRKGRRLPRNSYRVKDGKRWCPQCRAWILLDEW